MIVFPNVKINLGLQILRKRPDGYHDISTVMVGVNWCDVLEIVPSAGDSDSLQVSGLKVDCPAEKNLVMKALRAFRENISVGIPAVDIFLHKNVPDGAGLGGGSSDAAFTLIALNELFQLNLSKEELANIASKIGSDCPFFIYNTPMIAEGRGEVLRALPSVKEVLDAYDVCIIKSSDQAVSTAQAYSGVIPCDKVERIENIIASPLSDWKSILKNDFEKSIFERIDSPGRIKATLYEMGASYASMSGSGSSVYGLFEKGKCETEILKKIFPDCFIHFGNFIL